jgi:hypothetical protein
LSLTCYVAASHLTDSCHIVRMFYIREVIIL